MRVVRNLMMRVFFILFCFVYNVIGRTPNTCFGFTKTNSCWLGYSSFNRHNPIVNIGCFVLVKFYLLFFRIMTCSFDRCSSLEKTQYVLVLQEGNAARRRRLFKNFDLSLTLLSKVLFGRRNNLNLKIVRRKKKGENKRRFWAQGHSLLTFRESRGSRHLVCRAYIVGPRHSSSVASRSLKGLVKILSATEAKTFRDSAVR